jgi:hypothetical protein
MTRGREAREEAKADGPTEQAGVLRGPGFSVLRGLENPVPLG